MNSTVFVVLEFHSFSIKKHKNTSSVWTGLENALQTRVFLRRFGDPIRIPRIENLVPRIREKYHRVPRIKEIGSLHVHTGYLTFSLKKTCYRQCIECFENQTHLELTHDYICVLILRTRYSW